MEGDVEVVRSARIFNVGITWSSLKYFIVSRIYIHDTRCSNTKISPLTPYITINESLNGSCH